MLFPAFGYTEDTIALSAVMLTGHAYAANGC